MILLFSHVRTGRWASVMPAKLAETLGLTDTMRAIPIVEPEAVHTIGLVVPAREPMTPLNAALVAEARRIAATLAIDSRAPHSHVYAFCSLARRWLRCRRRYLVRAVLWRYSRLVMTLLRDMKFSIGR